MSVNAVRAFCVLMCVAFAGCGPEPCADDVVGSDAPLSAPARHLVGLGDPYPFDPERRSEEQSLRESVAARRALAWEVAAHLLEEVPADRLDGDRTTPRFQTWYDRDDLRRMHRHLRPAAAEDWSALSGDDLDDAFMHNTEAVLAFESWPEARLQEYVDSARAGAHDLGDISRVLYSPRAARHLLRSTSAIARCQQEESVDATERPPEFEETQQSEVLFFDGCGEQRLGPFEVAHGGSFTAAATGDAELSIGDERCGSCEVQGPATVELRVRPTTRSRVQVDLRYDEPVQFWAPCVAESFPDGATIVKAEYRRAGFGVEVPVHDTSAENLARLGDTWESDVPTVDPGDEDAALMVRLPRGERYRLVALHAMVKELDHWVWTTLWWSNDPNSDFGADRPEDHSSSPLQQYKVCSVTAFEEQSVEALGVPGLAESLAAVESRAPRGDRASWCSNPFIEQGPGNLTTNCIGCHQHAGTGLTSEAILEGVQPFEEHVSSSRRGLFLERTNFPSDYVFTTSVMYELLLEP